MAANYTCDYCESNGADFMIGMLANGDQTAVCRYCVPAWAKALTDALLSLETPATEPVNTAEAAQEAPGDQWEDDYPQGRPNGSEGLTEAPEADSETDPEPAPSADVHQ